MDTFNIKSPSNQSRQLSLNISGAPPSVVSSTAVTSCGYCHQLTRVLSELEKLERQLAIIVRVIGGMRR